jgi:hypothetical protein
LHIRNSKSSLKEERNRHHRGLSQRIDQSIVSGAIFQFLSLVFSCVFSFKLLPL